ncbi:MAG: NADH-quinone oxidoreductase subunit K [Coriobacteriia bacterium]|nr:NADH-quinone oxidoreductase subunit K [Coriobacteriia bacterium]
MSRTDLFALAGMALFVIGAQALVTRDHLLHKVLAFNIMGGGVFLVLVGIARRVPGPVPDPVPHAMVLTGIVVTVSATAFALAIVKRLSSETGSGVLEPPDTGNGTREGGAA